jgi:hypothetical protein
MDYSKVTSGFDAEIALDGTYLGYLLLLASDVGLFPATGTFGTDPVTVTIQQTDHVDRTYTLQPNAPPPDITTRPDAFAVEVLLGHPSNADLRITLRLRLFRASDNVTVEGVSLDLFVRLGLAAPRETDGPGLASITLSTELVDIGGDLVAIGAQYGYPKSQIMDAIAPSITKQISMDDVGSGGRIQDIALRKLEADGQSPAALMFCVNLLLRDGPQPDRYRPTRGDIALTQNFLEPGAGITLATRPALFGEFGDDAFYRRAVPTSGGYHYPVTDKGKEIGHFVRIDAGAASATEGANRLHVEIEKEYTDTSLPWDPNVTAHVYIFGATDSEGIMSFDSELSIETGVIASIVGFALGFALAPFTGGWSLLILVAVFGLQLGLAIAASMNDDLAEKKLDAALLDIAPSRFTYVRRRWDPFFMTHHQIGLRPGATLVTASGMAIYGTPALTLAVEPAPRVVIRRAIRDADGAATALIYQVDGLDAALFTEPAPAAFRGPFTQPDPIATPELFELTMAEASQRVVDRQLVSEMPYLVQKIHVVGDVVDNLLVISKREHDAARNALVDAHRAQATIQITADHDAEIRAAVLADFADDGIIPTPEQVEAAVAAGLQTLIDEDVAAYEAGALTDDLAVALEPLLTFELSPDQFGRLQKAKILKILEFDLVHVTADGQDRYYYRDHYDPDAEKPPADRLADNLLSKPRYNGL